MHDRFKTYLPWFTLREIPFVGNVLIKRLINTFHTPENIFDATDQQLSSIKGISSKVIQHIRKFKRYESDAAKELEQALKHRFNMVTLNEDRYPVLLKKIPDPPPILTFQGTLVNARPCISIVGSRNASSYGLSTAKHLAAALSQKGFQIVSGMARGIDSMAHQGAVSMKKKTIAVLGSGLNKIYPKENKTLFEHISTNGAVVSEFKVDAPPMASNFPVRNRIIAGLSCGTIVVEAARKSGSLITARLAAEYNREVFAVPGSIKSKKSEGTHALLKNGACLIESEQDVIDELHQFIHEENQNIAPLDFNSIKPKKLETDDKNDYPLLSLMDPYPVHIDVLVLKSGMTCADVTSQLIDLELAGKIIRHPGNFFSIPEGNIE